MTASAAITPSPSRRAAPRAPSHLSTETLTRARRLISLYPEPRSALIPLCHLAQEQDGWLTPEAMVDIAGLVGVTPGEVLGTASFYDMLHTEPVGRYVVSVCTNIACLLGGAAELLEHAESSLGIGVGGTTAGRDGHPGGGRVPRRLRPGPLRAGQPPVRGRTDTVVVRPAGRRPPFGCP